MNDPFLPPDDEARATARDLLAAARHASLGTLTPSGAPLVTRIAFGLTDDGAPLALVSRLSHHTAPLVASGPVSILIGEPGRGDPLAHPRLTLQAQPDVVPDTQRPATRSRWLSLHPKAALYVDFADFLFVRFTVSEAHLNGGFGRAYRLSATDLAP